MTQNKPTLYLDMDGVLADFNTAAERYLGATPQEHQAAAQRGRWPSNQWQRLVEVPNFYRHLPLMPQAEELVRIALLFRTNLDYDVKILTAIPKDNDMPDCFHDKIDWVNEHFPWADLRVHFGPYSHDKQHHCRGSEDILVDDRTSNCTEWRARGGRAIQVRDGAYNLALKELETLFQELLVVSLI